GLDQQRQLQVRFQGAAQLAKGGLDQQVLAAQAGRDLTDQEVEQHAGQRPAFFTEGVQLCPAVPTLDAQLEEVAADLAQLQGAALLAVAVMVLGEAAQQPQHMQRNQLGLPADVLEGSRQRRQVEVLPRAALGIRGLFTQRVEQRLLQLQ